MRVVVGCPVAERAWILPRWLEAVHRQSIPVEIVCLYTESKDNTRQLLEDAGAKVVESPLQTRPASRMHLHYWGKDEYKLMSSLRNSLLEVVRGLDTDWFLSLDSDIILPDSKAIARLIDVAVDRQSNAVAPLVDLEAPNPLPVSETPGPSWNWMRWKVRGASGRRDRSFVMEEPFEVDVIMAAMLLDRYAQKVRWHPHTQGEDIGWSVEAYRRDLRLMVDPTVVCEHHMDRRRV
jgi:glycosyltransferase involved in cell wall biosynthesis